MTTIVTGSMLQPWSARSAATTNALRAITRVLSARVAPLRVTIRSNVVGPIRPALLHDRQGLNGNLLKPKPLARDGAVATVVLNRPAKLNSLTPAMLDELEHCARELDADADVRVVVLTAGGGKAFCMLACST